MGLDLDLYQEDCQNEIDITELTYDVLTMAHMGVDTVGPVILELLIIVDNKVKYLLKYSTSLCMVMR